MWWPGERPGLPLTREERPDGEKTAEMKTLDVTIIYAQKQHNTYTIYYLETVIRKTHYLVHAFIIEVWC